MKKIILLFILTVIISFCFSCKKDDTLDLGELYEENKELAFKHFYGWGTEKYPYELVLITPKTATNDELILFRNFFVEGLEKLVYIKYAEGTGLGSVVIAMQYESVELAKEIYPSIEHCFFRKENILATDMSGSYLLIDGAYKEVSGYALNLTGDILLFDCELVERENMILPEGIKHIPSYSLISGSVKKIKCNKDLECLGYASFAIMYALENIELNDGLKEIKGHSFMYHKLEYIVIPKSVEKITAEAFENVKIYCEVDKIQPGWNKDFAKDNCEVYWAGEWEYVNGKPTPIIQNPTQPTAPIESIT